MNENMTHDQATAVTTDIVTAGKVLAVSRTKFTTAISKAKKGNAHTALGFKSWSEYVAATFEDVAGLTASDRDYLSGFMAGEGMSSRAVARALNVSPSTAARMIAAKVEKGEVKNERDTMGTDGKKQKAKKSAPKKSAPKKSAPKKSAPAPTDVREASTDQLREMMTVIADELSERWNHAGDVAAETALEELADVLGATVRGGALAA